MLAAPCLPRYHGGQRELSPAEVIRHIAAYGVPAVFQFDPTGYGPVFDSLIDPERLAPLGPGEPNRAAFDALSAHEFVFDNWRGDLDERGVLEHYLAGVALARGPIDPKLSEIMGLVACINQIVRF